MMKQMIACFLVVVLLLLAGCAGNSSTRAVTAPGDKTIPVVSTEAGAPVNSDAAESEHAQGTDPASPADDTREREQTAPADESADTDEAQETDPEEPETDPAEPGFPQETLESDPLSFVERLSCEDGAYIDRYDNEYEYYYEVPRIRGGKDGAMEINDAIDAEVVETIREAHADMEQNESIAVTDISFFSDAWEDVLSVIVSKDFYIDGHTDYCVYLYEVGTGRRLSTEALLERMGVTEEQFLSAAEEKMRETFIETYKEIPKKKRKQLGYYDALAILPDYANMDDVLAYPNADGEIMIIAPIPSLAGPAYFYETINLGLGAAD